MSGWSLYESRLLGMGGSAREKSVNRSRGMLMRKAMASPACHLVQINGVDQMVTITHKQDLSIKRICALPGESLPHGGLVSFSGQMWMITELDADNEVYERGLMQQCNYMLKWLNHKGDLIEKWCIVEDGTKYLVGEKIKEFMSVGDARIAVTIAKDQDTIGIERGMRFLIDDDSVSGNNVLAYRVTKPNRLFNVYNGNGIFRYILTECNLEDGDNIEMRVANYYDWAPPKALDSDHQDVNRPLKDIVAQAYEQDAMPDNPYKEVWL